MALIGAVPLIMKILSVMQGRRTISRRDRSAMDKFFLFLFFTVFLAVTVAGTLFALSDKFNEIINNPPLIFEELG